MGDHIHGKGKKAVGFLRHGQKGHREQAVSFLSGQRIRHSPGDSGNSSEFVGAQQAGVDLKGHLEQVSRAANRGRLKPGGHRHLRQDERSGRSRGDSGNAGPRQGSGGLEPGPSGEHNLGLPGEDLGLEKGSPFPVHPHFQESGGSGGRLIGA